MISQNAFKICKNLVQKIESNPGQEHLFYQKGKSAFANKKFMEEKQAIEIAKKLFQQDWKKKRYHHLVRLGGDITRSGLGKFSKATVLGALLWYQQSL